MNLLINIIRGSLLSPIIQSMNNLRTSHLASPDDFPAIIGQPSGQILMSPFRCKTITDLCRFPTLKDLKLLTTSAWPYPCKAFHFFPLKVFYDI